VFGRGDDPVNFVSATDVTALVSHAATSPSLRGQIRELGGPGNLTFNQVAAIVQETTGRRGTVRHIPRAALHTMAIATARLKPALARQARAALAMDTTDMTFDAVPTRRALPYLPNTDMPSRFRSGGQDDLAPSGAVSRVRANLAAVAAHRGGGQPQEQAGGTER